MYIAQPQAVLRGGKRKSAQELNFMQNVNLILKGIRADEMSFKLNGVRLQNGGKVSLAPTFSRRVRHAAENDKLFFVSLTVKIENTPEAPKPIDLLVTMTGIFETDAARSFRTREICSPAE